MVYLIDKKCNSLSRVLGPCDILKLNHLCHVYVERFFSSLS